MNGTLYDVVTLFVLLTFSVMISLFLIGVRIPASKETNPVRLARILISLAFFMLAFPTLLFGWFMKYGPAIVTLSFCLDAASYLLLMYSTYLLVSGKSVRSVSVRLYVTAAVIAVCALLSYFSFTGMVPEWCWLAGVIAALPAYVMWIVDFVRAGRGSEPSVFRTFWIKACFYVSTAISVYSGFVITAIDVGFPWNELVLLLFVMVGTGMSVTFLNRVAELKEVYRKYAVVKNSDRQKVDSVDEDMARRKEELRANINQWVDRQGYLSQDEGMEGVAQELGTDIHFLRYYFRTSMSSDFRTWRISLRIDHAKRLLETNRSDSMNQIAVMSGFSNASNFYKYFKQYTGVTPLEYRSRLVQK